MLLAFLIYNDGIGTIMRMATIYATELKIDQGSTIASILIVQFVGIPFAFLFGMLADRIGAKRSIALGLVVYVGICVVGYFMTTGTHFLILAILVGTVQGGTQALSRSLFASLIPRDKSGEFFGFFGTVEKFAGILGPATFAAINFLTGSSRGAIIAIIGFFVVGGVLLALVDVQEGQRIARSEEEAAESIRSVSPEPSASPLGTTAGVRLIQCSTLMYPRAHRGTARGRLSEAQATLQRRCVEAGPVLAGRWKMIQTSAIVQGMPRIDMKRLNLPGSEG